MLPPKRWLLEANCLIRLHIGLDPKTLLSAPHVAEEHTKNGISPFEFLKTIIEEKNLNIPIPTENSEPFSNKFLLQELHKWANLHCPKNCETLKTGCNGLVFGEGNPNANILFIGEAPGEQEDIQNRPFVGRSGKLLDKLLNDIDLQREDVYITNIVKFRPPKNRDPLPEEIQASLPLLLEQIDIIEPKVISTLGRHSTIALLPKAKVHQIRGKTQCDNTGRTILPIFHPAAALYDPNKLIDLKNQFSTLQALASGLLSPQTSTP